MSSLGHSPESYLATHTSLIRNTLNLSSLAIAIIGFSSVFKKDDADTSAYLVRVVGVLLFVYAFIYGLKTSMDFQRYLHRLSKGPDLPAFYREQLKEWESWVYLNYAFLAMLFVVALLFAFMKFNLNVNVSMFGKK
jgi:hypothetical protein